MRPRRPRRPPRRWRPVRRPSARTPAPHRGPDPHVVPRSEGLMATETPVRARPARKGRPPRRAASREAADRRFGYLLVAPTVILLLAVTAYPLIANLWNSFHFDTLSYGGLPHKFVGGQN